MQIYGPAHVHGPQAISAPHRNYASEASAPAARQTAVDQLDISHEASFVSRAKELPDVRAERVASIRAQIAAGAYETDEKLNVALARLFDEIA
jgi:negative regulator of flagellin synthesis FlgM